MDEPFDEIMDMGMSGRRNVNSRSHSHLHSVEPVKTTSSPAVVSPSPSPTMMGSSSRRSSGAPPPMGAFTKHTPDRWAQYEKDEHQLRKESDRATGNAIASAAERAAYLERHTSNSALASSNRATTATSPPPTTTAQIPLDDNDLDEDDEYGLKSYRAAKSAAVTSKDRLTRDGNSLPHPEEQTVDQRVDPRGGDRKSFGSGSWSFKSSSRRNRTPAYRGDSDDSDDDDINYGQSTDSVRAEALKVLEMADSTAASPYSVRRTRSTGGETSSRNSAAAAGSTSGSFGSTKHVPSALSGLDLHTASKHKAVAAPPPSVLSPPHPTRKNLTDRRWTISDSYEEEDEDDLQVVEVETRSSQKMPPDSTPTAPQTASWSSRYSVDTRLMALSSSMSTPSDILDGMDRQERDRMTKSARNMFSTSPYAADPRSGAGPKLFGNGFSFRGANLFGRSKAQQAAPGRDINLRTVWMDVDLAQKNGHSLPPPPPNHRHHGSKGENSDLNRRRRRICFIATLVIGLLATTIGLLRGKGKKSFSTSGNAASTGKENALTFYVTANVPYDFNEDKKFTADLQALPTDAQFLVHLGNIQDASISLCPEAAYTKANVMMRNSPVPVFAVPGPEDWNNCPSPVVAFHDWKRNVGRFEENFRHDFAVERQLGNEENFSFLHEGVLFIGLHLVGGRVDDKEAWIIRHAKNVQWVEEKISSTKDGSYRALIILANARPSRQQDDFFEKVLDDIRNLRKPVLYIHANSGNGTVSQTYRPFPDVPNLFAFEIRDGGKSPPMRLAVGQGRKSDSFMLRDP